MASRSTGEGFTYTFKSEISGSQLNDFKKIQERMNHAAMKFEGYLGQELSFSPHPLRDGYRCTARVKFMSLQFCLAWLDSTERRKLLNEAETSLDYKYHSLLSPILSISGLIHAKVSKLQFGRSISWFGWLFILPLWF